MFSVFSTHEYSVVDEMVQTPTAALVDVTDCQLEQGSRLFQSVIAISQLRRLPFWCNSPAGVNILYRSGWFHWLTPTTYCRTLGT